MIVNHTITKNLLLQQAGKKEGGLGEGIFARLFCAVGAVGWEAFPPFGIKPNGGNAGAGFQIIRAIFARNRFELRSAIATR